VRLDNECKSPRASLSTFALTFLQITIITGRLAYTKARVILITKFTAEQHLLSDDFFKNQY
jgi:hypothetical protein